MKPLKSLTCYYDMSNHMDKCSCQTCSKLVYPRDWIALQINDAVNFDNDLVHLAFWQLQADYDE